jgi:hypothetical protein
MPTKRIDRKNTQPAGEVARGTRTMDEPSASGRERQIRVAKVRLVVAYAELWHSSGILLEIGRARTDANYSLFLASSVFAAFAFEAFLNHVGGATFKSWGTMERSLSYGAKLALLCERLNVEIDHGREPWQTVKNLFAGRNGVAHGKNEALEFEKMLPHDGSYERLLHEGLHADWEGLGTEAAALDARSKLEKAMTTIHAAAKLPNDTLFLRGAGSGSATLVNLPLSIFGPDRSTPET